MKIKPYERNAKYYETDQMGIIHHSNYIRWFEEARVDAMEQAGIPYDKMEEMGIMSPVLGVECKYIHSVHFNENVKIEVEEIGVRPCGEKVDIKELRDKAESALKRYNYSTKSTSSSTDCNWPLSLGIPSVCFGLVEIHNSHTLEEHISLSSFKKGLDIGYEYIISLTTSFH